MRLRQLNIVSLGGLLALCVALVAVMGWGLQRLSLIATEAQHYFAQREAVGGALRSQIEDYLRNGDGEQLAGSLRAVDAIAADLAHLDDTIEAPAARQLALLRERLDGEMRGAGKIAGNPQALLLQAEAELRDGLASLGRLALQGNAPGLVTDYLRLTGELGRAVQTLALARERFGAEGGKLLADNVRYEVGEADKLLTALQQLPPLGIEAVSADNGFEALLWSDRQDAGPAPEESTRLREELGFVLGRYLDAFAYTESQAAALATARAGVREAVGDLLATLEAAETGLLARQQQIRTHVQWTLWGLVLLVGVIGCLLYGVQRHLGGMLVRTSDHLRRLADGDLGAMLAARSPIGEVAALRDSVARLQQALVELVAELQMRSGDIADAGSGVLMSARTLAGSQSRQREQSAQAADAVTELSAASERVAAVAVDVTSSTEQASALIGDNTAVIDAAVTAVDTLSGEMATTAAALLRLRDDAEEVRSLVVDIRSIADRTNLLALNAAIEAARAGEQGRGFAVVADEVRQLAGRSSEVSCFIGSALERISGSSTQLAQAVARQEIASRDTVVAARSAGMAQRQLVRHVGDIRVAVTQIAAQARGQHQSVVEVSAFINAMVNAAEQTATQADDSVRLSQALQETSQQLAVLAGRFALE